MLKHGQPFVGEQIVHAHYQAVAPRRGVRFDQNAVVVGNLLARFPIDGQVQAAAGLTVVLADDVILGIQHLDEDLIAGWRNLQGLPEQGEL